jgi:hypothetical protein
MGTVLTLLLIAAVVLGIIAIVLAVTHRPWTGCAVGAGIALVLYVVLGLLT